MWQYFMSILVVPRVLIIHGKLCYFWLRFSKIPKGIFLNWQDFQDRIASIHFILKSLGSEWFSLPYICFVFCLNYKKALRIFSVFFSVPVCICICICDHSRRVWRVTWKFDDGGSLPLYWICYFAPRPMDRSRACKTGQFHEDKI